MTTVREQIAAIEAALEKATPGPWISNFTRKYAHIKTADGSYVAEPISSHKFVFRQRNDVSAIATLHNSAPALIATIKALEDALTWFVNERRDEYRQLDRGISTKTKRGISLLSARAALAEMDKEQ